MSTRTAVEIPSEATTRRESGGLTGQKAKVLSNTECPSCFRKGTMEVFSQKHGEHTFCYSCGHRETSFYS
jgi:hypothetical protein